MLLDLSGYKLSSLNDDPFLRQEMANLSLRFEDVTDLNVSNCGLDDLFGIDVFRNLERLDASHNNISLLDPLASLNLKTLILANNSVEYVYVKELKDGSLVLSSDADPDYTESFLSFKATSLDQGKPLMTTSSFEYVDLSFNRIVFFKDMTVGKKLKVSTIKLSNNAISDFSGLAALSDLRVLDLSFNDEFDLEYLEKSRLSTSCKIFLQSTNLTNRYLLTHLLGRYENMVTHHETETVYYERPDNQYDLHLSKLKNKKFVDNVGDFAGFVYEGESSPSELLTPRYLEDARPFYTQDREEPEKAIVQLDTESTIDEDDNNLRSILNHAEYAQGPDRVSKHSHLDPRKGSQLPGGFNEVDFLISSMDLCKKIDMWSDDIKNTLYHTIMD